MRGRRLEPKRPAVQFVHVQSHSDVVTPWLLYWPPGHVAQRPSDARSAGAWLVHSILLSLSCSPFEPTGVVPPQPMRKVPAAHGWQSRQNSLPFVSWNWPFGQSLQLALPFLDPVVKPSPWSWCWPLAHWKHFASHLPPSVWRGRFCCNHSAPSSGLNVPTLQSRQ